MSLRFAMRSLFVSASLALFLAAPVLGAEYVTVSGDNVNVRTGPGTDNPPSMELFDGYPLKVLQKKGDWMEIADFEGDTGWIHNSLVGKNATVIVNVRIETAAIGKQSKRKNIGCLEAMAYGTALTVEE